MRFVIFVLCCVGGCLFLLYGCGGARRAGDGSLLGGVRRSITTIVVHHTAGMASNDIKQVSKEISRLHKRRFRNMDKSVGLHVAYHYLVTPDGRVWKARDPDDIGHHAGNWSVNKRSVAICVVGDFSKYRPTKAQVRSLDTLVKRLQSERRIKRVIPHSYCRATLCCGEYLKREIRKFSWGRYF